MNTTLKGLKLLMASATMMLICTFKSTAQTTTNTCERILGKWENEDRTRVIEFVKTGNSFDAIIKNGPDKSMIGQKQMTGLKHDKNCTFTGNVHLIKRGKILPCMLVLKSDNVLELTAKASFMSQSQTWKRAKN